MPFFAYVLRCADGTLYAGYTRDVDKRVATHNAGRGASYTRGRRPVELVHLEAFETQREAMQREIQLKKLPRAAKLALIAGDPRPPGPWRDAKRWDTIRGRSLRTPAGLPARSR